MSIPGSTKASERYSAGRSCVLLRETPPNRRSIDKIGVLGERYHEMRLACCRCVLVRLKGHVLDTLINFEKEAPSESQYAVARRGDGSWAYVWSICRPRVTVCW